MNEPHDPNVTEDIPPAQSIREAGSLVTVDHVHGTASTDESQPSTDAPATDLPTVPGYRVLREIARGGMGRVLAAHDLPLDREVALKIMLPGANADRFVRESKITARLPHPGIPPVYALGMLTDGSPFLAMKLIAGQTLTVELKTADHARLLQAFAQVCQAVGFAHSRGVIHRDLKPSNVMVGAFGEVQVMDWGLAKEGHSAEPATSMPVEFASPVYGETQAGSVLGTPGYMAPEQARGEIDSLDERCDVFGLGAILCMILTGRPAYTGQFRQETMAKAIRGDLSDAHARLAACGADAELIELARKCLAPEKMQRPRDAGAVAAAMAEYQTQVQERLKKAELDRAAATAREQEAQATATAERKARRRTAAALAVSLVSAAVLVCGGAWYYRDQQERASELTRRRSETEQAVTPALLKAEHLVDQAFSMVVESSQDAANALVVWQQALDALGQAEAALLTGVPNDSLTIQVENARRRIAEGQGRYHHLLTQALRREKLFRDLDDARMATATWKEAHFDLAGAAVKFAAAFREFGLDVQPGHTEDLAQRIREQEPAVRDALLVALDHWAVCVTTPMKTDLLNIARAADTDAWRADYRLAVGSRDGAALVRLNREPRRFTLPPASIQLLAVALQNTEHQEEALQLLRWARGPHPSDFWIAYLLGNYLGQEPGTVPADVEEQIGCFRVAVAVRPDASAAHNNLGAALYVKNRLDDALAEYDTAIALNPKHAPAHHNRGVVLADKYQLDDAIAEYKTAIALDPKDASSFNSLGNALLSKDRRDDAIAEFNKAIAIDPKFALAHDNLGRALQFSNRAGDAIAEYRKAIALNPKYAAAHYNLGYILMTQNQLDEAVAEFKKSIVHDPKRVAGHYELGVALQANHQFDDAITAYRRASALDPRFTLPYLNVGYILLARNQWDDALAEFNKIIAIDPNSANGHFYLGRTLQAKGLLDDAIAEFNRAIALDPKDVSARLNLGFALQAKNRLNDAIAAYTQAIELDPKNPAAHGSLGEALLGTGQFKEAKLRTQKALTLMPENDTRRPILLRQLDQCEALLALEAKLPDILAGKAQPKDNLERLGFIEVCQYQQRHFAAAVKLYDDAFAADAKLADDPKTSHRYNAACSAALAAAGQDKNEPPLDDAAKARFRRKALDWLNAEVTAKGKLLEARPPPQNRPFILGSLGHWKQDSDLAGIRDADAVAALPAEERAAFTKLWTDWAALLKKAEEKPK